MQNKNKPSLCEITSAQALRSGLGALDRDLPLWPDTHLHPLSACQEMTKTLLTPALKSGIKDQCSAAPRADGNSLTFPSNWPFSKRHSFWR